MSIGSSRRIEALSAEQDFEGQLEIGGLIESKHRGISETWKLKTEESGKPTAARTGFGRLVGSYGSGS